MDKARQDDIRDALVTLAKRDSQTRIDAAYAEFGKMGTVLEVDAFLKTVKERFGNRRRISTSLCGVCRMARPSM